MADIVVSRASDGKITEIVRRGTWRELSILLFFALGVAALGAILVAASLYGQEFFRRFQSMYGGILCIGLGGFLLCRIALGDGRLMKMADARGLYSRFYASLGAVPWHEVLDFEIVPSTRPKLGANLLTLRTRNQDELFRKANPNGPISSKVPFVTLESSGRVDLVFLKKALLEMKAQMSGELGSQGMRQGA